MENHTCLNCGHPFSGKFCNQCGEKVYTNHDRSVVHLLEEVFHFFTHFEGKFFNTLKAVLIHPGQLSADYCRGLRIRYFKPISFFFLLIIIYLLFPLFEGLNMRVIYHERSKLYGEYATEQVNRVMNEKQLNEEEFEEIFHHKGEKTSKFLLLIMIPFMAVVSWGLAYTDRKYYFDHFIFSTEAASMLILLVFIVFPMLLVLASLLSIPIQLSDNITSLVSVILFSLFVARMSRRFFKFRWWYHLVFTLIFVSWTIFVMNYIYKFILFVITIHLV